MNFALASLAHVFATLLAALVLLAGLETLHSGAGGIIDGAGMWLAGLLIFGILAVVSLPIGLVLRLIAGKLFKSPLNAALCVGLAVGLVLIPILNPALFPGTSFSTNPLGLVLIHGLAGLTGGLIWFGIESAGQGA